MKKKTLGKENAALFTGLASQGKLVFSIADAQKISGSNYQATLQALHRLVNAGWLVKLGAGKYALVSPDAGQDVIPTANRLIIGREIVGDVPYYGSHETALEAHNLLTRPVIGVTITTPRRLKLKKVLQTTYRFIYAKPEKIWGTRPVWVTDSEQMIFSDPERTLLDCLARPDLCGGISEVAGALSIGKILFDWERLTRYAEYYDQQAAVKRLGFLLDLLNLGTATAYERLQDVIGPSYAPLDPFLPDEGRYISRWKIILNIEPEELEKAAST
jgi:predicted transcriptional regulator of viral defense system